MTDDSTSSLNKVCKISNVLDYTPHEEVLSQLLKHQNGILTNNNKEMASLLNKYFDSVFTIENSWNIPQAHNAFPGTDNWKSDIPYTTFNAMNYFK